MEHDAVLQSWLIFISGIRRYFHFISEPSSWSFWFGGAAAELDSDVEALVFSQDGELDDVAGFEAFDGFAEVGDCLNVLAVDGDDQVGRAAVEPFEHERASALAEQSRAFDAGLFGGAVGSQLFDQKTGLGFEDSLDADFRAVDSAVSDQLGDDSRDQVNGDRKPDSGALAGATGDSGVDADQSAVQIQQRAA